VLERPRLRCRVGAKDGGLVHLALQQAHAGAVLQVDRGIEDHLPAHAVGSGAASGRNVPAPQPTPRPGLPRPGRRAMMPRRSRRPGMTRTILAAVAALMLAPVTALADPVDGLWQTEPDDGRYAHVRLGPCGDRICGTIARTF